MAEFWKELFSSGTFMPHGHCYLWNPALVWLQVLSNGVIGVAYVAISSTLAYLVYRLKGDMPFRTMYLAFGAFIVLCGWTHFIDAYVIWRPAYWFDTGVRTLTALVSAATALLLPRLIPDAHALARGARAARERGVELETAVQDWQVLYHKTAELEQLKSQSFANVSHELRTPLTLILGPLERLLATGGLPEEARRALDVVLRNARVLHDHVDDLLAAAKLEAGGMTANYAETDVAQLVSCTAANFEAHAAQRGIHYSVIAPGSLRAQVDPDQLRRVLQNLLSNAFKFTPAGGLIRCSLALEEARAERDANAPRWLAISVADSGPGIAPEYRELIFERFRQIDGDARRHVGGTGLGLAIARDLVALHGGYIRVGETPEGGALFRVELPATAPAGCSVRPLPESGDAMPRSAGRSAEAAPRADAAGLPAAESAAGGDERENETRERPRVLIVEDNPDLAAFVAESLAAECRTECATDGQAGLERALALRPDLIVTDVMMPQMSGDDLVRELRSRAELQGVPIVLLTARADEALRIRMLREGAQDYLTKPFVAAELQARVANLLSMKRARDVLQQERSAAETARGEFEAFSYSVAHDLRAPLRGIDGFSQVLLEDHSERLDAEGKEHLRQIRTCVRHMAELIEDLLALARLTHSELRCDEVDLSALARAAAARLQSLEPEREVELGIGAGLRARGDGRLLSVLFENLLGNAWKFTAQQTAARIEFGRLPEPSGAYYVRDNGAGFDMAHAAKLFGVFQRLHRASEFEGTGIGLATVQRIVRRHGGRVWAHGEVGKGATFYFTLSADPADR